jgi:PTH1 family peptidyl-tRNA hydrolase
VLSRFTKEERKAVDEAIVRAAEAVETIVTDGADAAMNKYNTR